MIVVFKTRFIHTFVRKRGQKNLTFYAKSPFINSTIEDFNSIQKNI